MRNVWFAWKYYLGPAVTKCSTCFHKKCPLDYRRQLSFMLLQLTNAEFCSQTYETRGASDH